MTCVPSRKHNLRRSRQSTEFRQLVLIQASVERCQHRKSSPGGPWRHWRRHASTAAARRLDERDVGDQIDQTDVQRRIGIHLDEEAGRVEGELQRRAGRGRGLEVGWRHR